MDWATLKLTVATGGNGSSGVSYSSPQLTFILSASKGEKVVLERIVKNQADAALKAAAVPRPSGFSLMPLR